MKQRYQLRKLLLTSVLGAIVAAGGSALVTRTFAAERAPLPLQLPQPTLKGTPDDLPSGPNIEPISDKPRPPFMAPKGTVNVALHKKVILSDKNPISGKPDMVTDGQKEAFDDQVV